MADIARFLGILRYNIQGHHEGLLLHLRHRQHPADWEPAAQDGADPRPYPVPAGRVHLLP